MESFPTLFDQITLKHDLFSHLMLLGIVQALFLSLIIFLRARNNAAISFLGWSFLFQSIVFVDVYLCYTGLMKFSIAWNDSTEPVVLLMAPSIYLFIKRLLIRKPIFLKNIWPHLLLPLAYTLTQIPYYISPAEVKINAYLGAYHSNLEMLEIPYTVSYGYHWIKDYFHHLVLASFLFYGILSAILVRKERKRIAGLPSQYKKGKYRFTRNLVVVLILLFAILFSIFYSYDDDGGDHFIGVFNTLITFLTSAIILMESRFFEKSWVADKYETLTLTTIQFGDIEELMEEDYYCNGDISLKNVAKSLDASPNLVSKLINSETGMNFNDYINKKRVGVAKIRLLNEEYGHLTVEAIGNTVGFKSKSAFYTAFKKHVGQSPSAFAKAQTTEKIT